MNVSTKTPRQLKKGMVIHVGSFMPYRGQKHPATILSVGKIIQDGDTAGRIRIEYRFNGVAGSLGECFLLPSTKIDVES